MTSESLGSSLSLRKTPETPKPLRASSTAMKLALAAVTFEMGLAACSPREVSAMTDTNSRPSATEQFSADTTAEATIPGMEISAGAEQRTAEIVGILSQPYYDAFKGSGIWGEAPVDSLVPFGVKAGDTTFDFVFVPQTVTPTGEVLQSEKLFRRNGFRWETMEKVDEDGKTSWEISGEPILWYKANPAQRGIIGFADIDDSKRSTGRGFEIAYSSAPPLMQKIINGEAQVEVLLAESEDKFASEISVEREFMGVKISLSLKVHESLVPYITEVTLNPNFRNYKGQSSEEALIEYTARAFFDVSWYNGQTKHTEAYTEEDFIAFMKSWEEAQKGEGNWEDLDFKVFANNLRTAGYKQERVTIRPMSSEETPEGITAINEFAVVFVDGTKVGNITFFKDNIWGDAYGTNLDGNRLLIYIDETITAVSKSAQMMSDLGSIPSWLRKNTGEPVYGYLDATPALFKLIELLRTQVGLDWRSAIKVSPPNEKDLRYNP